MEFEKYINQAEEIFINGNTFDTERIDFITNLEICDLLAVPGSGKTTALLAKLYCLAQNMPFESGSGILVLAHTNHAVDEIEKKLKAHCPQLFDYPNFVGTVQSFINRFLAIPFYTQKNNTKFKIIEYEEYKKEFNYYLKYSKGAVAYFKNSNPSIFYSANLNINGNGEIFVCSENKDEEIILNCPDLWYKEKTAENKITEVINFIKETKIKLFSKGYLNYSDCYFYAKKNILEHSSLEVILQERFKYVFVDEMQDLEDFQIKIIDDIFYKNNSKTIIQRIGDVNQSIFNSGKKVKIECDWKPRNKHFLKNSLRLTSSVANVVNKFVLESQFDQQGDRLEVVGCNKIQKNILPHLILINEKTTGEQIKERFNKIIVENNLHTDDSNKKNGFHIIGWSTEWDDDEKSIDKDGIKKYRLKDFFGDYNKELNQKKEDYNSLRKHLFLFDREKQTFEAIRKSILNALINILRIEGIYKDKITKHLYRKSNLIEIFKTQENEYYNNFNSRLFSWCFDIITKKNYEEVYLKLKKFIESTEFIGLNWYKEKNHTPQSIIKSSEFINEGFNYEIIQQDSKEGKTQNTEINIKLSSVHAVKGQTHCASMYIETSYYNYETKKAQILNSLLGIDHTFKIGEKNKVAKGKVAGEKDVRGKEALKMLYVGFSRPTHLLCFVVFEKNIKDNLHNFKNDEWEVIDDLINKN
ncbi:UvrD-helicase domain-containing protein [Flavobacterium branchiarum]|uniref:DNA 3'-5' helicase II n=2 Tax=Flavobacterium branchiarum TaxID=1114870 RepID=A0ABV5FIM8_9FLAO